MQSSNKGSLFFRNNKESLVITYDNDNPEGNENLKENCGSN